MSSLSERIAASVAGFVLAAGTAAADVEGNFATSRFSVCAQAALKRFDASSIIKVDPNNQTIISENAEGSQNTSDIIISPPFGNFEGNFLGVYNQDDGNEPSVALGMGSDGDIYIYRGDSVIDSSGISDGSKILVDIKYCMDSDFDLIA